jgi:hypothetical protein
MSESELRYLTWAGGKLRLLTAAGLTLELKGSGPELFSWAPKLLDERGKEIASQPALDLELRIQAVAPDAPQDIPLWRYNVQLGHADSTYRFPGGGAGALGADVIDWPMLPHRGLVSRLTARELRIEVYCAGFISGELPPARTAVQVSVQPAFGSTGRPSIVSQDVQTAAAMRFPAEANEWRLRQLDGQPIALGTSTLALFALTGVPIATPVDSALFYDWQPIPTLAAFWGASDPLVQADYR